MRMMWTKIDGNNARFHAILSSYLNIVAGIIDLILSIRAGTDEESFSMFGVALMTFVDISGSLLVLTRWQWQFSEIIDHQGEKLREMKFSCILGGLMTLLGVFLLNKCMWSLLSRDAPRDLSEGIPVALIGTASSLALAYYKFVIGRKLDSYVVLTDAMCSLCLGLTCVTSLLVLGLQRIWWWSDGVLGLAVGLYTLHGGVRTVLFAFPQYRYLTNAIADGAVAGLQDGESSRLLLYEGFEDGPENRSGYNATGPHKQKGPQELLNKFSGPHTRVGSASLSDLSVTGVARAVLGLPPVSPDHSPTDPFGDDNVGLPRAEYRESDAPEGSETDSTAEV